MSNAAWKIRKRVARSKTTEIAEVEYLPIELVLEIIDEEIELEAERQFTRPISQQAEQSRMLKEDK